MARPPIDIDASDVYKLAKFHCSNKEIAEFFDCSTDTIERRFAAELTKGRAESRINLRKLQWQSAAKGNVSMQIWLGKQYLGQLDAPILEDEDFDEYERPESMRRGE
jgi:hypothetical protein